MAQASDFIPLRLRSADSRIIGLIGAAHFVSHYYILLLPPLFAFIREDYGVSYTELGLAITVFNVVSAAFQTPTGFLIDRMGPRAILIGGLALGAAAVAIMGLVPSFWVMVVMMALLGLANTVYHPADYAILSHVVSSERMGRAFSVHTFCGMLGTALAPATLLFLQSLVGWRNALVASAMIGFAAALALALPGEQLFERARPKPLARTADASEPAGSGWRLLLSWPIVQNLLFFVLLAVTSGGISNYSVVALGALYGTPFALANTALSSFLMMSAIGVLGGGLVVGRARHGTVASIGLFIMAVAVLLIGTFDLGAVMLVLMMAIGGFASGVIMPSRDMIVRDVTPPGSFGKVFGFVTTGFNIGGIVAPPIYGALMDHTHPRAVFLLVGGATLLTIVLVITRRRPATAM